MTEFEHFTLVHQLRKRIRIIAPVLSKDPERAQILRILLLKRQAIETVKVVPQIASVTIHFDPQQLPKTNLLHLLESVLANMGRKSRHRITRMKRSYDASLPLRDLVIGVGKMSCTSCALYLEMVLLREPQVAKASVNYVAETARVTTSLSKQEIFKLIENNGYQAYSIDSLTERRLLFELERKHLTNTKKQLTSVLVLSLPVALLSLFGVKSRLGLWLQALFATPVVIWGGRDIFDKAITQAKQGSATMDSLIAIGVGSAYGYSVPALFWPARHIYFDAATGIIGFVRTGRYLEELTKSKVIGDIRKLVKLQPQQATLLRDNREINITADKIAVGDIVLIRPGEKVPADGQVISGLSSVDESMITGGAAPVIKEAGHLLYDGSINGSGVLQMRTTATGKDTAFAGLIHMVDQAQAVKLPIQKTADQIAARFVPSVMALSALTFGGWLAAGERVGHALANAVSVLLISCPCALGLATPAATLVGSGQSARRGIYIRNSEALETLTKIDTVIFDKTGTLTEGNGEVSDLLNISPLHDEQIIQLAASAEFNSEHFLAKAMLRFAQSRNINLAPSQYFHSTPDQGIRATVEQRQVLIGNAHWMQQHHVDVTALRATADKLANQGKTLLYVALDGSAAALFAVTDQIRTNAATVIKYLQARNIDMRLVTGDTEQASRPVAQQLGITSLSVQANPAKKLQMIRDLQQQGHQVAMIGDGINDAPALAAADVSLSIGTGTDIAIEAADLILVNGDIGKVADALELSDKTLTVIKQNLFWAFAYNGIAVPIAMLGKLNPTLSTASMAFSSLSVIVNSLRLNRH